MKWLTLHMVHYSLSLSDPALPPTPTAFNKQLEGGNYTLGCGEKYQRTHDNMVGNCTMK